MVTRSAQYDTLRHRRASTPSRLPRLHGRMPGRADDAAETAVGFETQADREAWLEEHHGDADGVWLRIPRKGSGITGVDHATALESALC